MSKKRTYASQKDTLWWASLVLALATIGIAPFFRGLFFPREQMVALMVMAVAFILAVVWRFSQKKPYGYPSLMDLFVVLFTLSYLIPFVIGPASRQLAMIELLKTNLYLFTFFVVSILVYEKKLVDWMLRFLYLGLMAVTLISLANTVGWLNMADVFVGGRIFGPLQYPNSTAALLLVGFFLGNYLYERSLSEGWAGQAHMLALFLILLTFFGTLSRGALLVLPIVCLIYFLLAPVGKRLSFLLSLLIAGGPAYLLYPAFMRAAMAQFSGQAMGIIFGGLILVGLLEFLRGYLLRRFDFSSVQRFFSLPVVKKIIAGILALFLIFLVFMAWSRLQNGADSDPAPDQAEADELISLEEEAQTVREVRRKIDLRSSSAQARLFWMVESVREITFQAPIFGRGGGAWEASYKSFQSYDYSSTQVHNSWVQILADTGFFGFLSFVGIWIMLIFYGWKSWYKGSGEQKILQATLIAATFSLGGHAVIDFDFSLSSIPLVLFSLFALSNASYHLEAAREKKRLVADSERRYGLILLIGAIVLALVTGFAGLQYKRSNQTVGQAIQALRNDDIPKTMDLFEKAIDQWPYSSDRYVDLARFNRETGQLEEAERILGQALYMEPYNTNIYREQIKLLWMQEKYSQVIEKSAQMVALEPWNSELRMTQSDMYLLSALRLLQSDDKEDTEDYMCYFNLAMNYPDEYKLLAEKRQEVVDMGMTVDDLSIPISVKNNAAGAAYILGEFDRSQEHLDELLDLGAADGETYFWLALNAYKADDMKKANLYLVKMRDADPQGSFNLETFPLYKDIQDIL